MIPRCIHELHLLNTIFIMAYEMSVVFTVCCVAPPGVPNEIRYQLTNPLNVICFRTDILRLHISWITFLCINQVWYRCFVFSLVFFFLKSKNKRIIFPLSLQYKISCQPRNYLCALLYEFPYDLINVKKITYFSITCRKEISYSLISLKIKFREREDVVSRKQISVCWRNREIVRVSTLTKARV